MLNLQKKLFATADSADYEELVHQLSINASQQMPTTTDTLQATYSRHKKKQTDGRQRERLNRPFPSSRLPPCQKESKCKTIHMKMSSTYWFIFMQIKLIFI